MKAVISWLETSFAPKANKFSSSVWIASLKDALMQTLPMIFLGSLFAMLAILNEFIDWLPSFWVPWGWTMGLISLFIAFLLPFNMMEKKRLRKNRFAAGMSSLALFLIIVSPQLVADGAVGFSHGVFGAGGMFIAIISGFAVGAIMMAIGKFSFFKEESAIPEFVRAWFDQMLPVGVIITAGWLAVDVAGLDLQGAIQNLFTPMQHGMQPLGGFMVISFMYVFLYSMGISTWVFTPIVLPGLIAAIVENMDGVATNLVTQPTIFSAYLAIGGLGTTMPLVLMMMRSRDKSIKALGKACLPPSLFNINEPVVFGAVAWNPILMIPMWLQGLILPVIIWFFTKVWSIAPIPMRQFDLWYTPFPISTWLTTGAMGLVLFAIVFAVSSAIWFPFFKTHERQTIESAVAAEKGSVRGSANGSHDVARSSSAKAPVAAGAR